MTSWFANEPTSFVFNASFTEWKDLWKRNPGGSRGTPRFTYWNGNALSPRFESMKDFPSVHVMVWMIAGIFMFTAILVSYKLINNHLRNFTKPIVQRKIIGILWMVPLYAMDSWLSLRFKDIALYLDMCRDCYEAYVIYLFVSLMIAYIGDGDEERVVEILETLPDMDHPIPFSWCNSKIKLDRLFLKKCKWAAMQFVVLKPFATFVAIVLESNGLYAEGKFRADRGYFYTTIILNASISYAFYYLVLFYLALEVHLSPYHPLPKFICIKAVLFLSFWQSVLIAFLVRIKVIHDAGSWTTQNVSTGIQNLLICIEMCAASFAHKYAFPYEEFIGGSSIHSTVLEDHLDIKNALKDFNEVMPVVLPSGFRPGPATIVEKTSLVITNSKYPNDEKKIDGGSGGMRSPMISDDAKGWRY